MIMKNTRTFSFSVLFLLSIMASTTTLYGQFNQHPSGLSIQAKVEEAKMAKDRALLVVRTGKIDFDKKIEEVFKKYWKLNKNISFTSQKDLKQLLKGNEQKYCVLTIQDIVSSQGYNGASNFVNEFMRFAVSLGEKADKKKPLFYQNIAFKEDDRNSKRAKLFGKSPEYTLDLDKKEILFALDYIQNHLIARTEGKNRGTFYYEVIENTGNLANTTLLIAREDLHEKLTEQDIKDNYPYKYKIVDYKKIEELYLLRSKGFSFVEVAPMGVATGQMIHYVVSCADGQLLSAGELDNGFGDRFSNFVNKDHIKAYVKNANRKAR